MPDLVFLPGAGGQASFWAPVAQRLSDLGSMHCIAYPGFGQAPADPAVRSLDDLYRWTVAQVPDVAFVLVAQSMGGVLAARLAIEHPDLLHALVLVATSGGIDLSGTGAQDWRPDYQTELASLPTFFVDDRTDLTSRLGQILAPTLLISGDSDTISPPKVAERLQALIRGARNVVVSGGKHDLATAFPGQVADAIRAHLIGIS